MHLSKLKPVESTANLRSRVERLIASSRTKRVHHNQCALDLDAAEIAQRVDLPSKTVKSFLDFLTVAVPDGDVYLFGGLLRDVALFGQAGFNSDIDLVVEGNWNHCVPYLESLRAVRNKFGGYRLAISDWNVDIWNASETWAFREELVQYKGVHSLTDTTVLNWDAILMNWRTRQFVMRKNYLEEIRERILDIVLEENPDPLGMLVRVLRHLYLKDAKKLTTTAIEYLARAVAAYDFDDVVNRERASYGNSVIARPIFRLFEHYCEAEGATHRVRFGIASDHLKLELDLER